MTETRVIELELTKTKFDRVLAALSSDDYASEKELSELTADIKLAWTKAKFRDEGEAHND